MYFCCYIKEGVLSFSLIEMKPPFPFSKKGMLNTSKYFNGGGIYIDVQIDAVVLLKSSVGGRVMLYRDSIKRSNMSIFEKTSIKNLVYLNPNGQFKAARINKFFDIKSEILKNRIKNVYKLQG